MSIYEASFLRELLQCVFSNDEAAQDGTFRIELVSTTKTVTTTIAGSQTDNLTISSDGEGAGVIRCKVTADNVQKSPVFSRSVSYYVVGIRNVINIEQYNYSNESVILKIKIVVSHVAIRVFKDANRLEQLISQVLRLQLGVEVLLVVVKHVQLDVSFFGLRNLNVGY